MVLKAAKIEFKREQRPRKFMEANIARHLKYGLKIGHATTHSDKYVASHPESL